MRMMILPIAAMIGLAIGLAIVSHIDKRDHCLALVMHPTGDLIARRIASALIDPETGQTVETDGLTKVQELDCE